MTDALYGYSPALSKWLSATFYLHTLAAMETKKIWLEWEPPAFVIIQKHQLDKS